MTLQKGKTIFPGVEDEVALEQAKGTISSLMDAVVELVTNSDDSYLSMEQDGRRVPGTIEICVERLKGGKLRKFVISDEASGMSSAKIEEIICYGKRTSEMYKGKSVRGFFGRGLKESIIALGTGEIVSRASGRRTRGTYYYDFERNKLAWQTVDADVKTDRPSGTTITITPRMGESVKCPTFETLLGRFQLHFALRDILSSPKREVKLTLLTAGLKQPKLEGPRALRYRPPRGQQIENRKIHTRGFGVAHFNLFEAPERLNFARNDPTSEAGILIKTGNATLDNQLFGFDNDPNAHYFFGDIRCPGIADAIRAHSRGLVRPDRSGLNWRHEHCRELEARIKEILSRHIQRKREQASARRKPDEMPKERAAKLKRTFRKLNALGREILAEPGLGPGTLPSGLAIEHLTIYPAEASAPPDKDRTFTVYAPADGPTTRSGAATGRRPVANRPVSVALDDPTGRFVLSTTTVSLKKHKARPDLATGSFTIKGFRQRTKTGIIARQDADEDYAEFVVRPERKADRQKGKEAPRERKGGLFRNIVFDTLDEQPLQRVYYNRSTGDITIYTCYPGIRPHLGANGAGSETERGSLLLSELIAEAFCRETARRKVESESLGPEAQLDQYLKIYNEHLKLCIPIVQGIWLGE